MVDFNKTHEKALNSMISIVSSLKNDHLYYDAGFECEYTPFEEDLKNYCESYCEYFIINGQAEEFFNSLTLIVDAIVECDDEMYDEDFFRPAELITYYFGKIITMDNGLRNPIREWLSVFCRKNKGDMIVEDYFTPFMNGEKIYHADNHYTGYDDLNRMLAVFK